MAAIAVDMLPFLNRKCPKTSLPNKDMNLLVRNLHDFSN